MKEWSERPVELANLLNPAFCGYLLYAAILSHQSARGNKGMPFGLAFLILPLVLHHQTRQVLPGTTATSMISWLQRNPGARIDFGRRVRSVVPYTREALMFLMERGLIATNATGDLIATAQTFPRTQASINRIERGSEEVASCASKSRILGRWFALSGDAATVFALLGVQP